MVDAIPPPRVSKLGLSVGLNHPSCSDGRHSFSHIRLRTRRTESHGDILQESRFPRRNVDEQGRREKGGQLEIRPDWLGLATVRLKMVVQFARGNERENRKDLFHRKRRPDSTVITGPGFGSSTEKIHDFPGCTGAAGVMRGVSFVLVSIGKLPIVLL